MIIYFNFEEQISYLITNKIYYFNFKFLMGNCADCLNRDKQKVEKDTSLIPLKQQSTEKRILYIGLITYYYRVLH